ncbi:hypothetical protein L226DRAFT_485955 [Lentinus tigrinus ALCF2SS1-7]|uniref:uncharacterized protein n=1 Tax=Lentinus tigrinus ALCF2SS1-7 TaxID=1328758 RepID=UPI0011660CB8|nr:hypothetical protein L226DRAFT_485955 [Lentinus tigrinus ALCF2SS1-7]
MSDSLVGSYVIVQINAREMVAGYEDTLIVAVAKALGTRQYVGLVEKEVQIPSSSDEPLWRVYRISFVGGHDPSGSTSCPLECVPIFPAAPSTQLGTSVKPSLALPLPELCHRPALEAFVRVHASTCQQASPWTLADEQIRSLVKARKMSAAHQSAETYLPSIRSEVTSLTFRSPASLPRDEADYVYSRFDHQQPASPALSALADLALYPPISPTSQTFSIQPPRITTPASDVTSGTGTETSVSALFERVPPRRHDTLDSASVYSASTARSSIALNLESPSTSKLVLDSDIDMADIALVDIHFDLEALEDLSDPAGFMEERNVVFQLVQKAKKRQRNAAAAASRAITPSSPKDDSRRLSISRIRSRQSADTYLSVTPTHSRTQSETQRAPRKLRRARSHHSSRRREPSVSRSVLKAEIKTDPTPVEDQEDEEEQGARARPASQNSLCKIGRFFRAVASRFALRLGLSKSKSKAKSRRRRVASGVSSVSRASSLSR